MLVLFFVFMALGMPIAYCMGLAAILTILVDGQLPVLLLAQQFYDSLDNFSLLAVPLFTPARAPAVPPRRRTHERRLHHRPPGRHVARDDRPSARRPSPGQHPDQHVH